MSHMDEWSPQFYSKTRKEALEKFGFALRLVLNAMPAGYIGADDDRNRFVTILERLIWQVEKEAGTEAGNVADNAGTNFQTRTDCESLRQSKAADEAWAEDPNNDERLRK